VSSRSQTHWLIAALALAFGTVLAAWADLRTGWISTAFDLVAHLFYEVPHLARFRRPSQLQLVRGHLAVLAGLGVLALAVFPRLGAHGRTVSLLLLFGYALRATAWICGGNLPLVPGDSCHYVEVATSVYRGQGPVKHYVESFFRDYTPITRGEGVLDDWATPLDAYVRAGWFWLLGIVPGRSLEETFGAAKSCSFVLNFLALPALYGYARRRFGREIALPSLGVLAVLPVHVIYAGFVLRESLVALLAILAVWGVSEIWHARSQAEACIWGILGGIAAGLAILARNTAFALAAAAAIWLLFRTRRRPLPALLWGAAATLTILPWAAATYREYGVPFYTYTNYYEYNFSWTVHHFDRGNTRPEQFYTWDNAAEILRVKVKSLLIIAVTSTMIVGLPLAAGFVHRLGTGGGSTPGRDADLLAATILGVFVLGTLKSVADVTQVAQLGRYYLPVFVVALPTAVAGVLKWLRDQRMGGRAGGWLAATGLALLWADPTWAYDASWFVKPYQLHWPALKAAGDWIREHPREVPPDARIMTWFPWELRVASDRITVLLPRSFRAERVEEVIRQYGVTHILWGSFEMPPATDPDLWEQGLDNLRARLGLSASRELYRSPRGSYFPVRLYRLR
jgi:hypothetical protein